MNEAERLRHVFFRLPLIEPFRVPAGEFRELPAAAVEHLRKGAPSEAFFDLTLRESFLRVAAALGGATPPKCVSSIWIAPCPECAFAAGASLCSRCRGTRRVVEAVKPDPQVARAAGNAAWQVFQKAARASNHRPLPPNATGDQTAPTAKAP